MPRIKSAPIERYTREVETLTANGESFGGIEDGIEATELPTYEKAALWLFAWSLRDPVIQRQDARLMLALVGGPTESMVR